VDIDILGPLTITSDGAPAVLPRGKGQRALFLCLLLRRNATVSVGVLAEAVWPGDRPATAAKIVQVYVSQWRKVVGDRLETRSPGYVLHVNDGELDADRAQTLATQAREAAPADALLLLDEALALWRGDPLAEIRYEPFAEPEVARLDALKVALVGRRVDAEHPAEL
jgi:DNA-binding SARP family transcriptional activator